MECLHCGRKINVLRKIRDQEFCSAVHRKAYYKKQDAQALDFLIRSKPKRKPEPTLDAPLELAPEALTAAAEAPNPEPEAPPVEPAAPEHDLVLAEFSAETVSASRSSAARMRSAQPIFVAPAAVLPAFAGPLKISGLMGGSFVQPPLHGHWVERGKPVSDACPTSFAVAPPGVRKMVLHPLWFGPEPEAKSRMEGATFITVQSTWLRPASKPLPAAAELAFPNAPAFTRADGTPACPGVRLARAGRVRIEPAVPAARTLPSTGATWQAASSALHTPANTEAVQPTGLLRCEAFGSRPPCVQQSAATRMAMVSSPVAPEWRPLIASAAETLAPPALAHARRAVISPLISRAGFAVQSGGPAAMLPEIRIHLGTGFRAGILAPDLGASSAETAADKNTPTVRRIGVVELWRSAPVWSKRLMIGAPLGAAVLFGAFLVGKPSLSWNPWRAVRMQIQQRATVDLEDDFRSGLSHWTGAPGWAQTWSYDATGFARPGRMGLLDTTRALTDYRFEFICQIEKKAVSWVFRAADPRNYYVTRMVEVKHGPGSAFSIERYAVVDGQVRLKAQLPLPMALSAKTLYRVRQEIRGTRFTTYVDGRLMDTWSDASLGSGGVGFFNDVGETAYIRWMDVTYQDDFLGRLCSYLSPVNSR